MNLSSTRQTIDAILHRLSIIPSMFFILLPVLAVRAAFIPVAPDATHLWPTAFLGDLRSWWKAVLVVGCALWMLSVLAVRSLAGWRPQTGLWPASIAAAFLVVVASVLNSHYPNTSWIGYTTQYEGGMALAAYLAAAWYISETADSGKRRIFLLRVILLVCLINACHGIAEGLGANPWRSDIGKWLMGAGANDVTFRFLDARMAYGTVFQPNHYGMLMAMLGSLCLGMIREEPTLRWKVLWSAGYACSLGAVFCSNSRAGIITFLAISAVYVLFWLFRKIKTGGGLRELLRGGKSRWPLLAGAIAVFLLLFGVLLPREVMSRFATRIGKVSAPAPGYEVTSLDLLDNRIGVVLRGNKLILEKHGSHSWIITDAETGERTIRDGVADKSGWSRISIPGLTEGTMRFRPQGNAILTAPGLNQEFYTVDSRIWAVDQRNARLLSTIPASRYKANRREGLLSGRGYIWWRVLEVAGRHPWLGSGPGTFAQSFPNEELLNRTRYSEHGKNEDKGHGVWATFLVQMGVAGTVLYILPFLLAMALTGKSADGLRVPLLMSMGAYCICALANDSTLGVTPIFCALAGLGVAGWRRPA